MSRPLRITYPGAVFHVTARGNERKDIYYSDADRRLFLRILSWVVRKNNWTCHTYCLMKNHYHLLIQTPDANLSAGMRQLNGVYAQKINERYQRVGHLFQGRFKAFLIEDDEYLLTVARYIVLNPVRAGLVPHPSKYQWSSYRQTAGLVSVRKLLTTNGIHSRFSEELEQAKIKFRKFVENDLNAPSPLLFAKYSILGSEQFVLSIGTRSDIQKTVSNEFPK